MMVCEEDVVNWFQGLKGHQRIPILRQLVHMCHPLELRFIASCVEDACSTDCLMMRSAELNANTQQVLTSLASPLDVEARSKIIVYLCLLNSTNKLCSRILSQKICDHESVTQFCDDVHKQMRAGELPSSEEQRTLDELRLLYLLASLHPSFGFIERQHYREMCSSLNDMENELKKLERKEEQKQVESDVPKPGCDGGSQQDNASKKCSLCFSTSAYEHICKLRLLPCGGRQQDGDSEHQVNVQWSTGKLSNVVIRDSELRILHGRLANPQLEMIESLPRLPPFPHPAADTVQLNSYLQHLQGISAVTWPRSEPVYLFFRQLADEQEQRGRPAGASRPHSVYRARAADSSGGPARHPVTNGLPATGPPSENSHKLTMPLQNGSAEVDSSSETSPAVLDDDAEIKSCTIYNTNMTNGRAGSRSPLSISRLTPACSVSPERPAAGWSPRAASHSPGPASLTNGVARPEPRLHQLLAGDKLLRKHADRLRAHTPSQLRTLSDDQLQELGLGESALRRLRALLEETSRGGGGTAQRRRTPRQSASRSGSVDKEEAPRPASQAVGSAPAAGAATTGAVRERPATSAAVSPRPVSSSALPPQSYSSPAPVPPTGTVPEAAVAGAASLQARSIASQAAGLMPTPGVPLSVVAGGPTYSAVTAHNTTAAPGALSDGVRCAPSDGQLVFTAHSTASPPPAGLPSGFRVPPRGVGDLLSAGSSPSPPAPTGSPAASLPPPPPPHTLASYLPAYSSRPPPPLQMPISMVFQGAGNTMFPMHGFAPAHEMPFYRAAPYAVQYAAVPPPRVAPPPPPSRPLACYNCGQAHIGQYCPQENMHDASQHNQFKMTYVSSVSEN